MTIKSGIHQDYFSILDGRYDVLVEAEVAAVTGAVAALPEMLGVDSFRLEENVPAGSDADHQSWVRVYRLRGHEWTQVFCPSDPTGSFKLGKQVSEQLATRCLQIELTDDAWEGHAFFDRGVLKEISLYCVGDDLLRLCPQLGLAAPEIDEDEKYEEIEFFHSELDFDRGSDKLRGLVKHLGLWVDEGSPVWDSSRKVERLDLLFPS